MTVSPRASKEGLATASRFSASCAATLPTFFAVESEVHQLTNSLKSISADAAAGVGVVTPPQHRLCSC